VPFGHHVLNHAQHLAQLARLALVAFIGQARVIGNLAQAREALQQQKLFSTGVPVRMRRCRERSCRTDCEVVLDGFLMACDSSRIT
jgi:hypothetical protein